MLVPACGWFSARASASSWLTRRVAASELLASCSSERWISALSVWRSASSDCMRMPASGVFIWCAASAMKRFCISMVSDSRASMSLSERTSGEISSGT
jgi:hypothetical protein